MSPSAPGPQDSSDPRQPAREDGPPPPIDGQIDDPALLERVLRETAAVCNVDEPLEEGDREALEEVAGRHRGERLTLEPVGVELVQAVLRRHFPALARSSGPWEGISRQIALSLLSDPPSRERMEAFWIGLGGGES